jgi:hypothetical protein
MIQTNLVFDDEAKLALQDGVRIEKERKYGETTEYSSWKTAQGKNCG